MNAMMLALWRYRGFVLSSIRNEYAVRFARSRFGLLWLFVHPLVQASIYALVFSEVLSARLQGSESKYAYVAYLLSGMVVWSLFSEIVSRCTTLFVEQGNLLKKMQFPRVTLVATVLGSCLVNNSASLLVTLSLLAAVGHFPDWGILWLLPLYLVAISLALGIGLVLGVLNVFIRDVGQVVPIGLQLLFWSTPVIYPLSIIPEGVRDYLAANPLYGIVAGFHQVLAFNGTPDFFSLVSGALLAALFLLFGLYMFRKASPEMADAL